MIIQHNMTAANANRQLAMAGTNLAKSTEKLSSGYRINRASDDAAGLAISEKMRGQIRGLSQASTNAQDGISMIQTAEGALSESQAILQRMRELSVQASNGTETDEDRANIQDEITQLQDELTRIADTTEFNTMKLLDGSLDTGVSGGGKVGVDLNLGFKAGANVSIENPTKSQFKTSALEIGSTINDGETGLELTIENEDGTLSTVSVKLNIDKNGQKLTAEDGTEYTLAGKTVTQTEFNNALLAELKKTDLGDKFDITLGTAGDNNKLIFDAKEAGASGPKITATAFTDASGKAANSSVSQTATGEDEYKKLDVDGMGSAEDIDKLEEHSFEVNGQKFAFVSEDVANKMAGDSRYSNINIVTTKDGTVDDTKAKEMAALVTAKTGVNATADVTDISFKTNETSKKGQGLTFQIGANEGQTISFNISNMSSKALGVDNVSVGTQDGAQKATTTIDKAINAVSKERAKLGAVQNRLEHTISNLDTSAENLQTAESRIRDVNMADEMVKYSKHSILQQASQSMLAQAKNSTQGVLSLLQ